MAPKGSKRGGGPGNVNIPKNLRSYSNSNSNSNSALPTPTVEATAKAAIKELKLDTNVPNVDVNPALLDRLSPSVRGVAEHAAVLRSVLARLGPIYDLVDREASRMTEVSPFLAGKDQVRHASIWPGSPTLILFAAQVDEARNRLTAEAQKREEKVRAIKQMIEAEKQRFVASINERLEKMIREVVVAKVKERVKIQVGSEVLARRNIG